MVSEAAASTRGCVLAMLVIGAGCGSATRPSSALAPPADDKAYLLGVWSTSTSSYDAASTSADAVRLDGDGTLHNGTSKAGTFSAIPNPGPSSSFVATFDVDHAAGSIHFGLDGADEYAHYTLEPPDRWKTRSNGADATVVYYVRRR